MAFTGVFKVYFVCMSVLLAHVYVYHLHANAFRGQKQVRGCRQLWAAMMVLGTELGSSARAVWTCNPWAISSAHSSRLKPAFVLHSFWGSNAGLYVSTASTALAEPADHFLFLIPAFTIYIAFTDLELASVPLSLPCEHQDYMYASLCPACYE